ncbi:hypothetical protein [uncultured Brevundimonas sp.]|uniref:hypothetical protein n=1 Tax=uncultured Brevundimonas sp. TaxID=213418 RepID=UPI0030EC0922|tara:strand:- start:25535 stop:26023 length:489 start_codon:yes stop_codon:yes gene_type:complete
MKPLTAAALLGALTAFASLQVAVAQPSALTRDWAQQLEASLDLKVALNATPHLEGGAPKPVAEYARYYRMIERDGRQIVEAVFAPPVEPHPSDWRTSRYTPNGMEDLGPTPQPSAEALQRGRRDIHIDEPFPVVFDGGCSVVTLSIDYESRRILSAHCNGVA